MIIGFSSDIGQETTGIVLGPAIYGDFSLAGVCLTYTSDPITLRKIVPGFNSFSRQVGEEVHEALIDLLEQGKIRTFIGQTYSFADVPDALTDQENRKTVGRTVIRMADSGGGSEEECHGKGSVFRETS